MNYEMEYEAELERKDREIETLENQVKECQQEIRRLRSVCREYEEDMVQFPVKELLRIFDEHNWKGSYSIGRWSIEGGGYDLWFQISEDGIAKIECVDGKVYECVNEDADTEQLMSSVLDIFGHLYRAGM